MGLGISEGRGSFRLKRCFGSILARFVMFAVKLRGDLAFELVGCQRQLIHFKECWTKMKNPSEVNQNGMHTHTGYRCLRMLLGLQHAMPRACCAPGSTDLNYFFPCWLQS